MVLRDVLENDLDAAGFAVRGLPHAATADAAVRRDDMEAGDTTTLLSAEGFTTTALAAQAFGTASSTTLQAIDASVLTEGAIRVVATYMAPWKLVDGTVKARTTIQHQVLPASGRTNWWWVRIVCDGDPFWYAVTDWYLDPAATNSTPGDDEAAGTSSGVPLRSMAEVRRRTRGLRIRSSNVLIHPLSSSTNSDDGIIDGITTFGTATVVLIGTTTVIFSGTLTVGTATYAGNNRGVIVDSTLPSSWSASDGISTISGSRYIRTSGGGAQAPILKDLGSRTAMIGLATATSETTISPLSTTPTSFATGDSYEVVTRLQWPQVYAYGCRVQIQCLDIKGNQSAIPWAIFTAFVLCGFLSSTSTLGNVSMRTCVFLSTMVTNAGAPFFLSCAFVGGIVQMNDQCNLNGQSNVFVNSPLQLFHGANVSLGGVFAFDNTTSCIFLSRISDAEFTGGFLVGSGNTGKLITTVSGSTVYAASLVSATTSDPLPYSINGVSYASPIFDGGAGNGIYN